MQSIHRSFAQGYGRQLWPIVRRVAPSRISRCSHRPLTTSQYSDYLQQRARIVSPKRLDAFIRVLQKQGQSLVSPSDRSELHPWLIPLAEADTTQPSGKVVTALLRVPDQAAYKGMPLPVVSMSRGSRSVKLVARSVDEYLHRFLAEEDATDGLERPLAEAAGADVGDLYQPGDVQSHAGKFELYLIRKAGMFPDVCESLAAGHLSRGDVTSALVASEWYMRGSHFPNWGRPYEYAGELYQSLDRGEEARDMTRIALRHPWWSLSGGYAAAVELAQLKGDPERVRYLLSEEAATAANAQHGAQVSVNPPKSQQQAALDESNRILDMVAAGHIMSWDEVRGQLAEQYQLAGLPNMAEFVKP